MRVETAGTIATVHLDEYADLLKVRALPDYRFIGAQTIECDAADLAMIGLDVGRKPDEVHPAPHLFDYQAWIVRRAVERERFAIFADTGLGKTAMQLEWARLATERHGGRCLGRVAVPHALASKRPGIMGEREWCPECSSKTSRPMPVVVGCPPFDTCGHQSVCHTFGHPIAKQPWIA